MKRPGHAGLVLADKHVDLGPDAISVRVNTGFNREAGSRQQPPVVVGLVVVHVHAVAVHVLAEAVSGPMDELRSEASAFDDFPAGAVDFVSPEVTAIADRRLHQCDGRVAPVACGGKGRRELGRRRGPRKADPGDVGEHRTRFWQLTPEIDQNALVGTNLPVGGASGLIVRIAGVLLRRHVRHRVGHQPLVAKPLDHRLLHLYFGQRGAGRHSLTDHLECAILDAIQPLTGREVCGERRLRPDRLETLREISRRDDRRPALPDRFDRPGVDARHVGDGVARRILHRHSLDTLQQVAKPCRQLLSSGVHVLFAGQLIEIMALDGVHQPARRALGRDEVVPAPGGHLSRSRQSGEPRRNGVETLEIVEQPAVELLVPESPLDSVDRQRHLSSIPPPGGRP